MNDLHFGYDRRTQEALWITLGERHWSSELNVSTAIPYAEMPGEHDTIQSRPVDRRAIIIEGDMELVRELLGEEFNARLEAIHKRINKRASK